jgi:hypothetical protein
MRFDKDPDAKNYYDYEDPLEEHQKRCSLCSYQGVDRKKYPCNDCNKGTGTIEGRCKFLRW